MDSTFPPPESSIAKRFYGGIWNSDHYKRLTEIGDELNKVRCYANDHVIDDQFTKAIVYLVLSSYYGGLVPIIKIESMLFVESEFRNEYGYALAARAYIEVAGRVHKGLRMWRQHRGGKKSLEELKNGTERLMAKYRHGDRDPSGVFKGDGFNVMTLIQSLSDKLPIAEEVHGNLSTYIHGDFFEQMMTGKLSWMANLQQSVNPCIARYSGVIEQIREIMFDDFNELLVITKPLRDRYDLKIMDGNQK